MTHSITIRPSAGIRIRYHDNEPVRLIRVTLLDGTVKMMPPHAGKFEYLATHAELEARVVSELKAARDARMATRRGRITLPVDWTSTLRRVLSERECE